MDFDIVWDDQLLFGKDVLHLEQRCWGGEWWVEWARKAVATKVRGDYSPKVAAMPRNRVCG
jgi:hypothetical protein